MRSDGHKFISNYFEYLEGKNYSPGNTKNSFVIGLQVFNFFKSPVTLCHSARHIMLTFKWAYNKLSGISRIPWAPFQAFLKDLSATYKRHNTKVKSVNGDNDMDVLQERNEWPSGGLPQLRRCVEEHAPESIRWVCYSLHYTPNVMQITTNLFILYLQAESLPSDPYDFTYFTTRLCGAFCAVMLAALYVFNCQGRPQAFQKLTLHEFLKFWKKAADPVSRFLKTAKSCKFQVRKISVLIIRIFVSVVLFYRLYLLRTSFVQHLLIFT